MAIAAWMAETTWEAWLCQSQVHFRVLRPGGPLASGTGLIRLGSGAVGELAVTWASRTGAQTARPAQRNWRPQLTSVPLVIRTPGGDGQQLSATHSQNLEVPAQPLTEEPLDIVLSASPNVLNDFISKN
jgi:hypothetical protein